MLGSGHHVSCHAQATSAGKVQSSGITRHPLERFLEDVSRRGDRIAMKTCTQMLRASKNIGTESLTGVLLPPALVSAPQ